MDDIYQSIIDLRSEGRSAVLVTVVASKGHVPLPPPGKMLADAEGRLAGTVGGGALEAMALTEVVRVLADGKPRLKDYLLEGDRAGEGTESEGTESTGMLCGGKATLFFEVLGAPHRVYLFGAGHVGQAVARVLATLDYAPVTVDSRPEFEPQLAAGPDYATLPPLPGLDESCVVIATHSHASDQRVLEHILAADERPRYLGLIASTRKWRTISADLRAKLGEDIDLDRVHAPAGLRLGGRTPADIALSIVAELHAVRTGTGRHDHMRRPAGEGEPPS